MKQNKNPEKLTSNMVSFCLALWASAKHKKTGLCFDVCMGDEQYERKSKTTALKRERGINCTTQKEGRKETCLPQP